MNDSLFFIQGPAGATGAKGARGGAGPPVSGGAGPPDLFLTPSHIVKQLIC